MHCSAAGDGALLPTGENQYMLDLGSTIEGRAALSSTLSVTNNVATPADALSGSFSSDAPGYSLIGFDSFSNLAAGATHSGLSISLPATTSGTFAGQIRLLPQSVNPQPFSADLPVVTINLTGIVYRQADFDHDGDVDGADLAAWSGDFGAASNATHAQGDADADGAIDGADFLVWQRLLGSTTPTGASLPTPEPSAAALLAIAMTLAISKCRRTTRRLG